MKSKFSISQINRLHKTDSYILFQETEEKSITAESSKAKVQVHGRRYYIDEDSKESMSDTADAGSMIDLDHSTNYFNDVDMMPSLNSSWAYIDKPELDNVERNVDDLIDKKIANHSQEHPPAERQLSNREYFQSGNNEVMQLNLPSELPVMTSESVIPSQLVVTSQSMKTSDSAITTVSSLDVPVSKSPTPSWDYQDIQGYSDDDEQSQSQSSSRADVNDNVLQKNASQYIQGLPLNSRDEKSIDIESNEEVSFMVTYL